MSDESDKYRSRAERMIKRWSGIQQRHERENRSEVENVRRGEQACYIDSESGHVIAPQTQIPILDQCEVLVVGGGPSGLAAALAAKRAGADTILMERYGCFGGVITTVGMETIAWYRYEGTVDSEGIGIEMERIAAQMGGTIKWPYNDSECLDADYFKIVADHLISESGVRPYLHCLATDVIMDGNRIKGVVTESKSGRQAILAKRVIDCTGDADVAHLSGADYELNPIEQRRGVTTVFNCAGVDKAAFLEYVRQNPATYADWGQTWDQKTSGKEDSLPSPYLEKEFKKARDLGLIPEDLDRLSGSWSALSDAGEATNLNLVHMTNIDCTNVRDLTRAEMQGRREALHAIAASRSL